MAKDAATIAANWVAGMQNPTTGTKYKQGIQQFQGNPMQLAAAPAAQQKYANNTAAAVTSGRMAAALNAVPLARWQQNAVNVGAMALSSGATKAKDKFTSAMQKWAPIYAQASQAAMSIPHDGSMGSAMARVQAAMQVMMAAAGRA